MTVLLHWDTITKVFLSVSMWNLIHPWIFSYMSFSITHTMVGGHCIIFFVGSFSPLNSFSHSYPWKGEADNKILNFAASIFSCPNRRNTTYRLTTVPVISATCMHFSILPTWESRHAAVYKRTLLRLSSTKLKLWVG